MTRGFAAFPIGSPTTLGTENCTAPRIDLPMPELTAIEWSLALLAAFGVGVSKGGFSGVGMFHVVVFANLFGARASTGIVLPMLIFGDVCAVVAFRQHARWDYVRRMLGPTTLGVIGGWAVMQSLDRNAFEPLIGSIILLLAAMQISRMWRPDWFTRIPHSVWFAWGLGLLAGFSTMLANAAGPIIALYLVAVSMPKLELAGTTAWLFLILNLFKVPFSFNQGLIDQGTLSLNVILVPVIVIGLLAGRWLFARVPQRLFDSLVLAFSALAALRLIGLPEAIMALWR